MAGGAQAFRLGQRLENDNPIPLIYYYSSFREQEKKPTKAALDGLEWALELAPYDAGLRMMVAAQQMEDKRFAAAIRTVSPLAYHPHAPEDNPAMGLLKKAREELAAQSVSSQPVGSEVAARQEPAR
jgi:hypothetical protein